MALRGFRTNLRLMFQVEKQCIKYAMHVIRCVVFRLSTADAAKVAQLSETGQGYSLWSEELQFTFVNSLQIIHKFKHEHEKEYSLHVAGAVGPLTMSCRGVSDVKFHDFFALKYFMKYFWNISKISRCCWTTENIDQNTPNTNKEIDRYNILVIFNIFYYNARQNWHFSITNKHKSSQTTTGVTYWRHFTP